MENEMTSEFKVITPEEAQTILDNYNKGNRHLNVAHANALAEQMKRGTWQMNGETIKFSKSGLLIDGQHRLSAVVKSGIPCKFCIVRQIDDSAFTTIDVGKRRTPSDFFTIEQIPHPTITSAAVKRLTCFCKRSGDALGNQQHLNRLGLTNDDLLSIYRKYENAFQQFIPLAKKAVYKQKLMTSADVLAFMVYLNMIIGWRNEIVEKFISCLFQLDTLETTPCMNDFRVKMLSQRIGKMLSSSDKESYLFRVFNDWVTGGNGKRLTLSAGKGDSIYSPSHWKTYGWVDNLNLD